MRPLAKKRRSKFVYDEKIAMMVSKDKASEKSTYCASPVIIGTKIRETLRGDDRHV